MEQQLHLRLGGLALDICTVVTFLCFCVQGSDSLPQTVVGGIALASVAGLLSGHTSGLAEWATLLPAAVGWAASFAAWWLVKRKDAYPRASLLARRVVQIFIMSNVGLAAVLMLDSGMYVSGAVFVLLAAVAPDWSFVDDAGRLSCDEQTSFFGYRAPISSRWYMRIYYTSLSFRFCFEPGSGSCWFYSILSCLVPLIYQEVLDPMENVGVIFKVQPLMSIANLFVSSCIDTDAPTRSTPVIFPHFEKSDLVVWNAAILATAGLLLVAADRMRTSAAPEPSMRDKESSESKSTKPGASIEMSETAARQGRPLAGHPF